MATRHNKANSEHEINTCIACNQACLDHIFKGRLSSCLVNPRACHETELIIEKALDTQESCRRRRRAGRHGLRHHGRRTRPRGHLVRSGRPDRRPVQHRQADSRKEDFAETLRYFARRIETSGVTLQLNQRVDAELLKAGGFDHVVLATGISPRQPAITGIDSDKVSNYVDLVEGRKVAGKRVAIIGAGGIGFDVGDLPHRRRHPAPAWTGRTFCALWGIDDKLLRSRGGLGEPRPDEPAPRQVLLLLQRKIDEGRRSASARRPAGSHRAVLRAARCA
jgi:2,4-dienoyl-CoA reductase (NADPH2)